jgi:hypothetical protein
MQTVANGSGGVLASNSALIIPFAKKRPTPPDRAATGPKLLRQWPSAYPGESGHKRGPVALPPMRGCARRTISRPRVGVEIRVVRRSCTRMQWFAPGSTNQLFGHLPR